MLRKQTKKIIFVMLLQLTLVLPGRVDENPQTAASAIITASVMMQALRAIPPEANVIIMHPKVIFPVFLRERVIMSRSEHLQQNHPVHRMILHGQKRSKL